MQSSILQYLMMWLYVVSRLHSLLQRFIYHYYFSGPDEVKAKKITIKDNAATTIITIYVIASKIIIILLI